MQVVLVPEGEPTAARPRGRVDMQAMMQWLAAHETNEVHVEAGFGLNGALLAADCVDELVVYMAPMLLGEGKGIAEVPLLTQLDDAHKFEFLDFKQIGANGRYKNGTKDYFSNLNQIKEWLDGGLSN